MDGDVMFFGEFKLMQMQWIAASEAVDRVSCKSLTFKGSTRSLPRSAGAEVQKSAAAAL